MVLSIITKWLDLILTFMPIKGFVLIPLNWEETRTENL